MPRSTASGAARCSTTCPPKRANGRYEVDLAKYSQLAWAEVKPRYRRLIDCIARAKTNIIICTRAKPVMQQGFGNNAKNARKTKTRREDV